MSVNIHDERLKRLAKEARRRRLRVELTDDAEVFIVPSSRGVCYYQVTLTDETVDCPCAGAQGERACTHAAAVVGEQCLSVAREWRQQDSAYWSELRYRIRTGRPLTRKEQRLVKRAMQGVEESLPAREKEEACPW